MEGVAEGGMIQAASRLLDYVVARGGAREAVVKK